MQKIFVWIVLGILVGNVFIAISQNAGASEIKNVTKDKSVSIDDLSVSDVNSPINRRLTLFDEDSISPVIVCGDDDVLHMAWIDSRVIDFNSSQIFTSIFYKQSHDFGNTWTPAMKLTESIGKSTNVDVALNSKSEINLCWEEKSETSNKIYYGNFDSNGNELSLSSITNGASTSSKPTIALDSNDYYYMLWQDDRDVDEEIYFSTNLGEFDKQMDSIMSYVELLPDECFTKTQFKKTLLLNLGAIRTQLEEKAYIGTLNKFENDILKKMDGYLNENTKDDWIVDPGVQQELSDMISGLITGIELKVEGFQPIGGSQWCDVGTVWDTLTQLGPQICNVGDEWSSFQILFSRTCRSGKQYSNFWLNIENTGWAKNIDYRITFSFYASANIEVKQLSGPSWTYYKSIGYLPGNGAWKTCTLETKSIWNYDYNAANSWCNILLEFEAPLFLDSISVIPVSYNCDVTAGDANIFAAHNPGINIHPYLDLTWASTPTSEGGHTYRIGDFNTNQLGPKFWINLLNDPMSQPSIQCEYRLEIAYKILGPATNNLSYQPYIQQWDGTKFLNVLKLNSDGGWHTSIGIPIITGYYDYGTSSGWGQSVPNYNVIFQIGLLKSDGSSATLVQADIIGVGSLSITVARDYCDVGTLNDNVTTSHEPGPSIYPDNDWSGATTKDGKTCRLGNARSNIYLNDIDTSKDYVIRITYRSPSNSGIPILGYFKQWGGTAYQTLGTYIGDDKWHTDTFIAKNFWQSDYNGANPTYAMNALFEFSWPLWVDEISVGVMEKYAILIGGGAVSPGDNYDAFKNDLFEMYNGLKGYNGWKDENMFCYLWDQPAGKYYYNNNPIILDGNATRLNMEIAFTEIKNKITLDDFFLFTEICHSTLVSGPADAPFGLYMPGGNGEGVRFSTHVESYSLKEYLDNSITDKCARSLIIAQSCWSGYAVPGLSGANRIVIIASRANEKVWTWKDLIDADDHWEFLHNDQNNGFTFSIGCTNNPQSILTAYYSGYDAARDSDGIGSKNSHPVLDDNGDGIGHEKGNMGGDGAYAEYTWL